MAYAIYSRLLAQTETFITDSYIALNENLVNRFTRKSIITPFMRARFPSHLFFGGENMISSTQNSLQKQLLVTHGRHTMGETGILTSRH